MMLSSTHSLILNAMSMYYFKRKSFTLTSKSSINHKSYFILDDYNCVLCNACQEEISFHLFFECAFSQSCWNTLTISWNLSLPPLHMVIDARSNFGNPIFREICITACWVIWTTRNAVIFDNAQISINDWKRRFKEELWVYIVVTVQCMYIDYKKYLPATHILTESRLCLPVPRARLDCDLAWGHPPMQVDLAPGAGNRRPR